MTTEFDKFLYEPKRPGHADFRKWLKRNFPEWVVTIFDEFVKPNLKKVVSDAHHDRDSGDFLRVNADGEFDYRQWQRGTYAVGFEFSYLRGYYAFYKEQEEVT